MHTRRWIASIGGALAVVVTGCVHTYVDLEYVPKIGSMKSGAPTFAVGEFLDLRAMPPPLHYKVALRRGGLFSPDWETVGPTYLGSVRSAPIDGQSLPDHVFLNDSAANVVARAMADALQMRGMLGAYGARHIIVGEILELSVDTLKNQHAVARLRVTVKSPSGHILHTKVYKADRQSLDHYPQSGDQVLSLRKLASHALQDAIDHALDDPSMRKLIGRQVSSPK